MRLVDAVLAQLIVEQAGVEARPQADRQREARVFERHDQDEVHQLGRDQRDDRDFHRRADVLARIETRRQHFHQYQADESDAVGKQRAARHPHILDTELAVVKQSADQRHCQQRQRHGSRQRQQQSQAQTPVEQAAVLLGGITRVILGQTRQQDGAQRHPQHAGREFHQPVGVIQP